MSSTIQNTNSVSSFALVIGLIIVLSLLVGIGAIIYRKKYHLNFKNFFAKFKNNYNNKINGKNIKNNKINGKNNNNNIKNNNNNIKNNNNNIKNGNNNIKSGNGNGNGKINKKNIKNKDDGTNYKNKNYQGHNSSISSISKNPRSKTAKNDNNVLPNNNLFLTKNNALANNNNNNNSNISQQSKLLNHQNIEKEKEEKIRNKKHLQQPINNNNESVMNEITRLPTAYAPRARVLYDDNKRSKSETFSSSPLSYPSLSTSTKFLKPTQTKSFVSIKSLNSSSATSPSNKANNNHLSIDESHYESSQNSSQTIVLNLCDYYTDDNNTIDNRHSKGNYIDSYYHNSNYSGNAEQAEDHHNHDNDTNNNENDNKIKIDVNESPPVNIKSTSSKLKKNSYDNYSPPLKPLSPPPQSTTLLLPKNFSISDSFKTLASSPPSLSTPTSTIIRPKNFSISDSFKTLTSTSPSSPSRLNSWLTSSPNKNDNVNNDKFLTLNQNTDGNIASSDSTPTNNRYTNNDIYDNYIYKSIYYSRTDSVSIDPHLYDKSNTNSIYYILIDNASKKISRVELIKESEHEYEHKYGEDYKGGDHNEEAIVFDSRNYDNDSEIKILVEDNDFNKSRISDSPIELPKLPKILVNKNLSINFERFSLFRNAPGCIDKDGYYYDDNNRNLNGNSNSNNRVTNVYF
nr:2409_t:CDS:2 [Entrophospora candida]